MSANAPEHSQKTDLMSQTKGLVQSLSEGIRSLLVLDEKLGGIGRENERARVEIARLQEISHRLVGKLEEMDKRIADRFNEFDKRLAEIDKRIDLKVELAVKKEASTPNGGLSKPATSELVKPSRKRTARMPTPRHTE